MTVRMLTEQDLPAAAAVESTADHDAWSESQLREALESPLWLCLGAERDGAIVGTCILQLAGDTAEIHAITVLPTCRRQGVGAALLRGAQQAVTGKATRLLLEVRAGNVPARALYAHLGFTSLGVRKNFYEHPREDAQILEWRIEC